MESFPLSHLILLKTVEITNHMRKAEDIYSELAIARESAITTCVVVDSNLGTEVGMVYSVTKGKSPVCLEWRLLVQGKLEVG